jgi:hypothetical protein
MICQVFSDFLNLIPVTYVKHKRETGMAKVDAGVIQVLRATAQQLEKSMLYQWGHMGSCNCGFLAQQVTRLNKAEIHSRAMQRYGDWNDQLNDYCPTSGLPFDDIIGELLRAGFAIEDLKHLEKLSDPEILNALPARPLTHNIREDVVVYLRTWADLLERKMIVKINLHDLFSGVVSAV